MIDLHVHSTASDGTCSPKELAERGSGFLLMALTDHDNCDGVDEFLAEGAAEASSMAGYYCMPPNLEKIYKTAPPVFKHNHEIQNYLEMCKGSLYNRGYYNY